MFLSFVIATGFSNFVLLIDAQTLNTTIGTTRSSSTYGPSSAGIVDSQISHANLDIASSYPTMTESDAAMGTLVTSYVLTVTLFLFSIMYCLTRYLLRNKLHGNGGKFIDTLTILILSAGKTCLCLFVLDVAPDQSLGVGKKVMEGLLCLFYSSQLALTETTVMPRATRLSYFFVTLSIAILATFPVLEVLVSSHLVGPSKRVIELVSVGVPPVVLGLILARQVTFVWTLQDRFGTVLESPASQGARQSLRRYLIGVPDRPMGRSMTAEKVFKFACRANIAMYVLLFAMAAWEFVMSLQGKNVEMQQLIRMLGVFAHAMVPIIVPLLSFLKLSRHNRRAMVHAEALGRFANTHAAFNMNYSAGDQPERGKRGLKQSTSQSIIFNIY